MGALFRIRIIQSILALSIIGFAGFNLIEVILSPSYESGLLMNHWATLGLLFFGALFIFFRKTLLLPLILIALASFLFFTEHQLNPLPGMWIGLLLILLAYPVFFYKYLDFKQMLSMLRFLVFGMLAAGSYFYLQTHAKSYVATGVYLATGVALIGNLLLLLNKKKNLGTGLLLPGWFVLGYFAYSVGDFIVLACLLHFPLFWLCLHHDTEEHESSLLSFVRNPYFRVVAIGLIVAAILSEEAATVSRYLLALN